ncbi:MAG: AAA family ATPase [Gammaproteobacteria bacterium]|nr:AAA family ATPase [Gammaproteobacteria bacterium]
MNAHLHPRLNTVDTDDADPALVQQTLTQLSRQLIGKETQISMALACLIARGHLLIEDVPGVGKTTLAHALSLTLGLPWQRVQFTSDLLPADVLGVSIFNSQTSEFEFKAGPVFTSVLLADEINRAPPRAQSALLEAMEERQVTVDGVTRVLDESFFVIATQNPTDQLGAFPLPESQLDRFLVGLEIGYPDAESERKLLMEGDSRKALPAISAIASPAVLRQWSAKASSLFVSEHLLDYVQALIAHTRRAQSGESLTGTQASDAQAPPQSAAAGYRPRPANGLSPRAALSLLAMARAWAMLHDQNHVLPEDIQAVFPAVAGHRLTGSVRSGHALCREILDTVAVP